MIKMGKNVAYLKVNRLSLKLGDDETKKFHEQKEYGLF
jgi:hypothetical protein